ASGFARRRTGGVSSARPSWGAPSTGCARPPTWCACPAGTCCAPIAIRRLSMGSSIGDRLSSMGLGDMNNSGGLGARIRRVAIGVVVLIAALVLLPTTITYVNPGYVGIVIHRAGGG